MFFSGVYAFCLGENKMKQDPIKIPLNGLGLISIFPTNITSTRV